jgi:hypothetical protein
MAVMGRTEAMIALLGAGEAGRNKVIQSYRGMVD